MLSQNHPNPFNPSTEIHFGLPRTTVVTLRIFDLSGRNVRTLIVQEEHPAGWHSVSWDGRDQTGKRLASDVYFYKLEAGPNSETKKMTLLK